MEENPSEALGPPTDDCVMDAAGPGLPPPFRLREPRRSGWRPAGIYRSAPAAPPLDLLDGRRNLRGRSRLE